MPPIVSNEMSRSRYGEGPGEGDAMSPPSRGSAPCMGSRVRVKVAPEGGDAHDEHAPLTPEQTIFCGTPKGLNSDRSAPPRPARQPVPTAAGQPRGNRPTIV